MNLTEANSLAIKKMREHGLLDKGWRFKFDRGTKRFGCCKYGLKTITLSKALTEVNGRDEVLNTITHEIAHALVGHGHGHDHVWAAKHRELGGDGKRHYSTAVTAVKQRYKMECPAGHVKYTSRKPTRRKSCGTCSRRFSERYVYRVTDTRTGRDVTPFSGLPSWFTNDPDPLGTELAKLGASIPIIDVPARELVAASEPETRLILKRVDSHEWQTKDGTVRFCRGYDGADERQWKVVRAADGYTFHADLGFTADSAEIFPTLRAAKEAYQS